MIASLIAAALSLAAPSLPPSEPGAAEALGPRIAQIRAYSRGKGERLWPGYGAAPFGMLLIEADVETLLCQPGTSAGFAPSGRDKATGCPRQTRARSDLSPGLLAAMPLFGPPSTIVMGTPAATGRSDAGWLRTILHEHFHQWQSALPGYYDRVGALDLTGGDQSGMWMLNFAFPYADEAAGRGFAAASHALADALAARGTARFLPAFDRYLAARRAFSHGVGESNWRYLEFQLWQEGVARWTEIELGRAYPDAAVRASARELEASTLRQLRNPDLKGQGREVAYPFGTGEAMLMQACGSAWRKAYPRVLAIGPLLEAARASCRPR